VPITIAYAEEALEQNCGHEPRKGQRMNPLAEARGGDDVFEKQSASGDG